MQKYTTSMIGKLVNGSVPAFRTGTFPSRLSPKNETGIPEFKLHIKIQDLSTSYWVFVIHTNLITLCLYMLLITNGSCRNK